MANNEQFPKGWEPDTLGQALGGRLAHTNKDRAGAEPPTQTSALDKAIAADQHTKTATVTAAARPKPKPVTPKSKRRR